MNSKQTPERCSASKVRGWSSIALTALVLLITVSMNAQTNFSGTWKFNESKSKLGDEGGPRMAATSLVVIHDGNSFSVERTQPTPDGSEMKSSEKYTLDGKENINPGMMDSKVKSLVTWAKDRKGLNFDKTISMERDGDKMEFKSTESWTLSSDGKTLSIDSTFSSPMGEMKTTLVYDKK